MPIGESGYAGTRPKLGFKPKLPQNAAGMRTLPAPSVPTASGPMPAATAAALPPDEPPAVLAGFQGLRVMPVSGEFVSPLQPNSGVVVLPRITAPVSRRRAVAGASTSQACAGSTVREPRKVGQPLTRIRSLIETGTPSRSRTAHARPSAPRWRAPPPARPRNRGGRRRSGPGRCARCGPARHASLRPARRCRREERQELERAAVGEVGG